MLYDEFLEGIDKKSSNATLYAYKVINRLYMVNKLRTKLEAYVYFENNRNDFMWVDELMIFNGSRITKSQYLTKIISEDDAKKIINELFCFEMNKIEICGFAYYEVSDYNHIIFSVKGYPRVYNNGQLYDIYR